MSAQSHKYEIIIDFIKEQIAGGKISAGDKILSENELARKFQLSRFTVRHAIELMTNENLLEKKHGSGTYLKSDAYSKQKSKNIGVVTTYVDDYIFPNIIHGIDDVLTCHGYTMTLSITGNKMEKERISLETMLKNNIDGLIIEGTKSAFPNINMPIIKQFQANNIPIVFINSTYSDVEASSVLMDDEKGGSIAADYLISRGHTKIGGIFKSDDIQGHKRYKGFADACRKKGIEVDENAIIWFTTEDLESIINIESTSKLIERLRNSTAMICYNDQISLKMIEILERNGMKVPRDISIVSFDNSTLAEMGSVKLTSLAHSGKQMGMEAAEILVESMQSGKTVKKTLSFDLVERNSVKTLK